MIPLLAALVGLGLAWLTRRQQPPRALLSGAGPYFWVLAPVIALFTWMMLAGWDENTAGQKVGIGGFIALMWVLVLAVASPARCRWAPRVVTASVALTYAWYFLSEVVRALDGGPLLGSRSEPTLLNALLGLLCFGVPAGAYALRGRRGHSLWDGSGQDTPSDDPASGHAGPDA